MELDPIDHAALVEGAEFVVGRVHGHGDARHGADKFAQPGRGFGEGDVAFRLRPEIDPTKYSSQAFVNLPQ